MKIRIFDNDNNLFEHINLSDIKQSLYILDSYNNYFSDDYFREEYYDGKTHDDIYKLPTINRYYFTKDNVDYYVGDLVEIRGTTVKKNYITELVLNPKTNHIEPKVKHFRWETSDMSYHIVKKVGTIYDQYLKK